MKGMKVNRTRGKILGSDSEDKRKDTTLGPRALSLATTPSPSVIGFEPHQTQVTWV